MPQNITLDDGFLELSVNGDPDRVIRWNPTDASFVDRFARLMSYAEGLKPRLEEAGKGLSEASDSDDGVVADAGERIAELGRGVSAELDKAFNAQVSKAAFMGANPLSVSAGNGRFLLLNLLDALEPIIKESFKNAEQAREKYTKPFRRNKKQ